MLELIDLDIESLGYEKFISSWIYQEKGRTFLVDPGPAATIEYLVSQVRSLGIKKIDWVLLTHIHMDHSGGIGHLLEHFPDARVVCHEKAVEHLIDPERLLEGSKKVLKAVAAAYGDIKPVAPERIVTGGDFKDGVKVIPAPGHAPHHQCFVFPDIFFCGELFGIFKQLADTFYLRPATPPRFVLEDFLQSMERARPYMDRKLCFSHHGSYSNGHEILEASEKQLRLWVEVVRSHAASGDINRITDALKAEDPIFARVSSLPERQYQREIYFTGNSIRGILGYLAG
jgi:glyoxylase-like metal-dependent hydrolase (beta-lactamase superfamily II)